MSAVFTGVAVASLYMSNRAAKKQEALAREQNEDQRKANAAAKRVDDLSAENQRIEQARNAYLSQAEILNTTLGQGVGINSSGVIGGASSVASQAATNIGDLNVAQGFGNLAAMYNQRAADKNLQIMSLQRTQQMWQNIGSIALSGFAQKGGWGEITGSNPGKGGNRVDAAKTDGRVGWSGGPLA